GRDMGAVRLRQPGPRRGAVRATGRPGRRGPVLRLARTPRARRGLAVGPRALGRQLPAAEHDNRALAERPQNRPLAAARARPVRRGYGLLRPITWPHESGTCT